jgi:hypothetical protein
VSTKAKCDKEAKKKDGSLLTFFKQAKAIPVPSTVSASGALWMTPSQRIGFAMLVKCYGKDEAASVHADDVRLLYRHVPDYIS